MRQRRNGNESLQLVNGKHVRESICFASIATQTILDGSCLAYDSIRVYVGAMQYRNHEETRVFFYLGKIPVGYAVGLSLLLACSMILSTVVGPLRYASWLAFSTDVPLQQSWWRIFFQPLFIYPEVRTVVQLVMIGYCGHLLESAMRQRDFTILLLFLWLTPPILALVLMPLGHSSWAGVSVLSYGLFFALICHHPNRPSIFGIPVKWIGVVFLLGCALELISVRQWVPLLVQSIIWFSVWRWMKHQGYALPWGIADDIGIEIPQRKWTFRDKAKFRLKPKIKPQTRIDVNASSAIDRILDKVSRDGIHTLTEKERRILQNASDELKK